MGKKWIISEISKTPEVTGGNSVEKTLTIGATFQTNNTLLWPCCHLFYKQYH